MKCQRCGNEAVLSNNRLLADPTGPEATDALELKGVNGTVRAEVCDDCGEMLRLLGWTRKG